MIGERRTDPTGGRPVVVLANRLPVARTPSGWRTAAGGLVAALRPLFESSGGTWIGWSGSRENPPSDLTAFGLDLKAVPLGPRLVSGYYHGFSNQTLWPLLHDLVHQPVIDRRWWESYRAANGMFAATAASLPRDGGREAILWVNDYHLMLLPQLLREANPTAPILYFLHTPFPAAELFARLPWRSELLRGLLGSDVVGFHTELYRDNFVRTCRYLLPDVRVDGRTIVLPNGRAVRTGVYPISVDARELTELATGARVQRDVRRLRAQFGDQRVLLGIDRLDYTKGILQRLHALEQLLERRADLRGHITFVQIAEPSRNEVPRYREIREEVEQAVGRIAGRFTEPGRAAPVRYMFRSMPVQRILPYYVLADVALVTPLKDGMNLVAKEYVVCQAAVDGHGVLVLSEFAGAARELTDAIICNPFDEEGLSDRIEAALSIDEEEGRRRVRAMGRYLGEHDVFAWASSLVADAPPGPGTR